MLGLAVTAFLVGLAGGVHCAAMCGGLVAAFNLPAAAGALPALPVRRGRGVLRQLGYSGGRITSYAAAGAIAGAAGSLGLLYGRALAARIVLLVAANAMVVLLGLYLAGAGNTVAFLEKGGAAIWRLLVRTGARLSPAGTPLRAFAVGLAWGWIPCGLVYGVLATAVAAGSAGRGAAVMAAFGLGTLPNLLVAGLAAEKLRRFTRRPRVRLAAGVLVVLLGLAGFARIPGIGSRLRHGGHGMPALSPVSGARNAPVTGARAASS
jgi:sulfite exporter TauE/SafE